MKIGAVIQCRFNSQRLPGKILRKISDNCIIDVIVSNLKQYFDEDQILVATSEEETDDKLFAHCRMKGYNVIRGSLDDVSSRFLNGSKEFGFDFALRVNGDNYFMNAQLLDYFFSQIDSFEYDLITNVPGRTFGYGMSLELINMRTYRKIINKFDWDDREHVTKFIYDNKNDFKIKEVHNKDYPNLIGKKLAIDTSEDFEKAELITQKIGTQFFTLENLNEYFKS